MLTLLVALVLLQLADLVVDAVEAALAVGLHLQHLRLVGLGQGIQGGALLLLQPIVAGALGGQRLLQALTSRLLLAGVTLLQLAARVAGVVDLGLGALELHARTAHRFLGGLHPLVGRLHLALGGLHRALGTHLGGLGLLDGGQQAGLLLGVLGHLDRGQIQAHPEQLIVVLLADTGRQVAALQQLRRDHLAQTLLPAGTMEAQEVAQCALGRITLLVQAIGVSLGPGKMVTGLVEFLFGLITGALEGVELLAQRPQRLARRFAVGLGLVEASLGQLRLLDFLGAGSAGGQLGLELGQPLDAAFQALTVALVELLALLLIALFELAFLTPLLVTQLFAGLAQLVDTRLGLLGLAGQLIAQLTQASFKT